MSFMVSPDDTIEKIAQAARKLMEFDIPYPGFETKFLDVKVCQVRRVIEPRFACHQGFTAIRSVYGT